MTQPLPATPITAPTHPDPYPFYADLVANRPFGYDTGSGLWVAAGASAVSEVLTNPACRVRPSTEPVPRGLLGTPAGDVFGELARMTDGPSQVRRKQLLLAALSTVTEEQVVGPPRSRRAGRRTGRNSSSGCPHEWWPHCSASPGTSLARLPGSSASSSGVFPPRPPRRTRSPRPPRPTGCSTCSAHGYAPRTAA